MRWKKIMKRREKKKLEHVVRCLTVSYFLIWKSITSTFCTGAGIAVTKEGQYNKLYLYLAVNFSPFFKIVIISPKHTNFTITLLLSRYQPATSNDVSTIQALFKSRITYPTRETTVQKHA